MVRLRADGDERQRGYDRLTGRTVHFAAPIVKKRMLADGTMIVSGPCTDETLDRDEQIVDGGFARRALQEWFADLGASVRNMHSGTYPPAGKGISLDLNGDKPWIAAKIVEPTAIKLIHEGVYKDFSVGIFDPVIDLSDPKAPGGRIVDGWIGEVSLVDLGSNKNAHFTIAKRAKRGGRSRLFGVAAATVPKVVAARAAGRSSMSDIDEARLAESLQNAIASAAVAGDVAGAAVAAAVTKTLSAGLGKGDPDDDVDDAIDEMMDSLEDVAEAQADDQAQGDDKPTDDTVDQAIGVVGQAVSALAAAQAADEAADAMPSVGDSLKSGEFVAAKNCPCCGGSGRMGDDDCPVCGGSGIVRKRKKAKRKAVLAVKTAASRAWYAAFKRDMDPNVGGGVDRDKLKPGDFVFPKERAFPVVTPGDVSDAVSSWGRYRGKETFDAFKKNLTALARRKGPKFVAELPDSWTTKPQKTRAKVKVSVVKAKRKKVKPPKKNGKIKPIDSPKLPSAVGDAPPPASTAERKAAERMHDLLCPAIPDSTLKATWPRLADLPLSEAINPTFFADRLRALTEGTGNVRPDTVGDAYQAAAAAARLATVDLPTFERMRAAAAKTFADSYPNVHIQPGMIRPEDLRRGYLAGATPETASSTHVPTPNLAAPLDPADFRRPALSDNETRPTLSGGQAVTGYTGKKSAKRSVKKRAKRVVKADTENPAPPPSRLFYRNADRDAWSNAMSLLHDHIARHFPGTCPMEAVIPGTEIDSDGQMGSPAEMNATGPNLPSLVSPQPSGTVGTLQPVKSAKVGKGPAKGQLSKAAVKGLVEERVRAESAKMSREWRKERRALKAKLAKAKKQLSLPDPRFAVRTRGAGSFAESPADAAAAAKAATARKRVEELKARMGNQDSQVAARAVETLMGQLSPREFAAIAVSD